MLTIGLFYRHRVNVTQFRILIKGLSRPFYSYTISHKRLHETRQAMTKELVKRAL